MRLIPAQFVKPFLKGHKNDYRDAEAIAEAVQRPTMSFVACWPCIVCARAPWANERARSIKSAAS
jgi:transposase